MRNRYLLSLIVLMAFNVRCALAVGLPENVLVVQNGNSPVSTHIAAYYMSHRNIPSGNLVTLSTQDSSLSEGSESIDASIYQSQIEDPIRAFLSAHNLVDQIQFIVLTKGVPHRLSNDSLGGPFGGRSVDSVLASIDLVNPIQVDFEDVNNVYEGTVSLNRYWRASDAFSHWKYGGYLVTRLDGYTEADAKALVDRALAPQSFPLRVLLDVDGARGTGNPALQPKGILDSNGDFNQSYVLTPDDYQADMVRASQILALRPGVSVQLDQTTAFVGSSDPLTGYCSWGSNDHNYNQSLYFALPFAPASIAETVVSTSARSFLHVGYGQSLITDLINDRSATVHGTAGAKGYDSEPFLDSMASPSVLFDFYLSGRNLAESYYAASRFVAWKDVVVGDPLCAVTGSIVSSVSDAKGLSDKSLVTVSGMTVTAGTEDFGNSFYMENENRSSGIQVRTGGGYDGVVRDAKVDVRGLMSTVNGERAIQASAATLVGTGSITPLEMTNRNLGGGDWNYSAVTGTGQKGILGAAGLNNIGLLVRTSGRVVAMDAGIPTTWFQIDDGSGVNVKCLVPTGVTAATNGQYAFVTGISSCEKSGSDLLRLIKVRDANDIVTY